MLDPLTRSNLASNLELAQALSERAAGLGYLSYLNQLIIASKPEARPFREVSDPWQREDAAVFAPRLDYAAGIAKKLPSGTPQNFWRTRPRGHDKTGQIARMVNFLLGFARRPVNCVIAAVDGDQANIMLDSMKEEAQLNPWLSAKIDYHAMKANGPGGSLRVLKADAPSAYGQKIDLLIFEELTWWKKQDLWTALWSGSEKRPGCITTVITNAGALGSWQHDWKIRCESDPTWSVEEVPVRTHLASWMSASGVAKLRSTLPPGIAARVFDNRWVSPSEAFGFLSDADILQCIDPELPYVIRPTRHFLGIDYGPRRDRTALCVVHREGTSDVLVVDELVVWQGRPESPIQVERIEQWIDDRFPRYRDVALVFDPYQMEASIQRYQREGRVVYTHEARGGKANYEMAENLRSLIVNHRIRWRPGDGLLGLPSGGTEDFRQELQGLVMKVTPYGYRFDHTAGHHDDRACAVGMACLQAVRDPAAVPWLPPTDGATGRPVADHRLILGQRKGPSLPGWNRPRGDYRGLMGTGRSSGFSF